MEPSRTPPFSLAAVCADLDRRLRAGEDVRSEDILKARPDLAARADAAQELILTEFAARRDLGQNPDPAAWLDRFPQWRDDLRVLFHLHEGLVRAAATPSVGGESLASTLITPADGNRKPATPPPPPPVGVPGSLPPRFGRFRILRRLGQGGMGSVYLAHDLDLDRQVALKVPQLSYMDDALVERFLREARAIAAFDHPNVCPVHDVGEIDGTPYLTMAFIEGKPLSDRIRDGKPLPPREVADLVRELAEVLAYVHRQGVVHRDLKPANVMLTAEGRPVVVDFGLALRLNRGDVRLTTSDAIVGTPAYLAPEQVEGRRELVGPACDIYALGVILYELLTGKLPFTGSLGEILVKVARDEPPPPSSHVPGLDPALEAICLRTMAKKIEDRYANMDALAAALAGYLAGKARDPWRWRRRLVAAGLVGAAGVGLALAVWVWHVKQQAPVIDPSPPRRAGQSGEGDGAKKESGEQPKLVRDLIEKLGKGDVKQRADAAKSLKTLGARDPETIQALVGRVADDRWEADDKGTDLSKEAALDALKALAPAQVTDALKKAKGSINSRVRAWAEARLAAEVIRGIGRLGNDKDAEAMEKMAQHPDILRKEARMNWLRQVVNQEAEAKKDWQHALAVYTVALKGFPDDQGLAQQAAWVYGKEAKKHVDLKQWKQAIDLFTEALKLFPDDPLLQNNLAYCIQRMKKAK